MKHLILSPPEKAASLTTKFVFYFLGSSHFPFSFLFSPQIIFLEGCTQHCTLFLTKFCKKRYYLCNSSWLDLQWQLIRNPCDNTNNLICNPSFMHRVYIVQLVFFLHVGVRWPPNQSFFFITNLAACPSQIYESTCLCWSLLTFLHLVLKRISSVIVAFFLKSMVPLLCFVRKICISRSFMSHLHRLFHLLWCVLITRHLEKSLSLNLHLQPTPILNVVLGKVPTLITR